MSLDPAGWFPRLPYPLRVAAASAHGLRLARRRYGGDLERKVSAALERESWDAARWRAYLDDLRTQVLERAAARVPHYREVWRGADADLAPRRLADWPVLDKETVRRAPESLHDDEASSRSLFRESTSGTTGTPLRLVRSVATERAWFALVEARSRRWYGVSRRDPWAILGGRLVAPQARRRPPFWVWNAGLLQLYLSSVHLAPDLVRHYLGALRSHGVRHLYGYSSALHDLALGVLAHDRDAGRDLGLEVVVTNAEPLLGVQRRAIEEAFGCPARETWGMAELVAAAGECEHGSLHLWPEVGVVERGVEIGAEIGASAAAGQGLEPGLDPDEIIATTLLAVDQPLVRYRLGDRLAASPTEAGVVACACGRTLPVLTGLEGRVDDVLVTPDGRRVGRLDPIFKGDLPLREAQIVQETASRVRLRYVLPEGADAATGQSLEQQLTQRLAERLGSEMELLVEAVDRIPRDPSGKFRAVVRLPGVRAAKTRSSA